MRHSAKFTFQKYLTWVLLIACGCVFISCTPLRKKFIREKKKEGEESGDLPILDPISYPPPSISAQKQYSYHYSLLKVWGRELEQTVRKDGSEKRQQYLVSQMMKQIEEMKAWVTTDQQAQLEGVIGQLRNISSQIEDFSSVRNKVVFERNIQRLNREVSRTLKPAQMERYFIN